ncbi:unnamed protein product [Urochloa humidicola]
MEMAAHALLGTVKQLLAEAIEEYRLLSGVRGEVNEVRHDLATMNALLRMQSEAEEGAVDHFFGEWMKQLRELAYDAEDSVDRYKLRVRSRSSGKNAVTEFCFILSHLVRTLKERCRLAGEIQAIRDRAVTISERHARYGVVDRNALRRAHPFAPVGDVRIPPALPDDNPEHIRQFVDLGGHADRLTNLLREDDNSYKVVSVQGFAGVGKTTLAMEVCQRLEAQFPYQAVVSVSQAFEPRRDLHDRLERICQQLGRRNVTGNIIGVHNLQQYLSDRRYIHTFL